MATPKTSRHKPATSSRRPVRAGKNAPRSEKVQASVAKAALNRTFLVVTAAVICSIILISGILLWFNRVYADPENVFWGMVDNNLATFGVTKQVEQEGQGGSSTESTQLTFNPNPLIKNVRQLSYPNEAGQVTKLTLEGVITPKTEYQHYSFIDRPGDGNQDYSKIYGLWLRNPATESKDGNTAFNNNVYNVFLFGNLNRSSRVEVTDLLRDAYKVNLNKVDKKVEDGRRTYTYSSTLNLRKYAEAAKRYANIMGLPSAGLINPNNYAEDRQLVLKITVDVLSRQLTSVEFEGGTSEKYSGYGTPANIQPPTKTVSSDQLQKAIEEATKPK